MSFSLKDLFLCLGQNPKIDFCPLRESIIFSGGKSLKDGVETEFSFFVKNNLQQDLHETKVGACFVPINFDISKISLDKNKNTIFIPCEEPYFSFVLASNVSFLRQWHKKHDIICKQKNIFHEDIQNISQNTWIPWNDGWRHFSAQIHHQTIGAKNVIIGPFSVLGPEVSLGEETFVGSHCFLKNCHIGKRNSIQSHCSIEDTTTEENVVIASGCRIGQEGFGFLQIPRYFSSPILDEFYELYHSFSYFNNLYGIDGPKNIEFPFFQEKHSIFLPIIHQGKVYIGSNSFIGSNTCIHRGSFQDTIIGNSVHIDNLVQIAHNVTIGSYSIIAAQGGLAGSSHLGEKCLLGGQVGLGGHLYLAPGTQIAAQSGVMKSSYIPGKKLGGSPAMDLNLWKRWAIFQKKDPREFK